MGEIVNLGRTRKQLARVRQAAEAQQNRVRFGRTAAQKQNDIRQEALRLARHEGKRRPRTAPSTEAPSTEAPSTEAPATEA